MPVTSRRTVLAALLAASLVGGCQRPERPELPAIARDTALIDDAVAWTNPFVPGHRTTMDGRVATRVQGGPAGPPWIAQNLSFYLFVPERLTQPILPGPPGPEILAETDRFDVPLAVALRPEVQVLGHHAICDPTGEFAEPGERTNPYACGPGGAFDCYDFTVISTTREPDASGLLFGAQLWGTPVHVEVSDPKTPAARIESVDLGESVAGKFLVLSGEWTEPAVTIDGRLLTGRYGRVPHIWKNPETGETFDRFYDLMYSVLPEDAEPCDVTGWQDFHPISHAPYDPQMVERYGLAAYPFRDSEGNLIPDGEDVGGTYPWVDREGANVFMAGVQGRLVEQPEDLYPRRCVTPGCESLRENNDWDRGFLVGGLWTHGKFVHLDGMINNLDWAVGVTPSAHFWVKLYRDAAGEDVETRIGSGRFIDQKRYEEGPYPPGYTHNANILDSIQNLLNFKEEAKPVTPRDVVWIMSTGVGTDEIVFDDYLDPRAFIVSNMQASITGRVNDDGATNSVPHYWNGQYRSALLNLGLPLAEVWILDPWIAEDIHIQNAATSLGWKVPAYGLVHKNTGRVEPTALGGVQGKGFWMTGRNEIRYDVPAQDRDIRAVDWYVSIFLDRRDRTDAERRLFTFPDGSEIRLVGAAVRYLVGGEIVHEVAVPEGDREGWMHLGWRLLDGNRRALLYVDGFGFDRYDSDVALFEMVEGPLFVGKSSGGVRGWIDDFKVLAHDVDPEVACNHAHGTLVDVGANAAWGAVADGYPAWAHHDVAAAAGAPADARYACFHDYSADYAAHKANLPPGTTSMRNALHFPEGPIVYGRPRPDSSGNPFCLSCHTSFGKGGLTVDALVYRPEFNAEDDPRRQPLQPPRRVFGNIPAGWIPPGTGPGGPEEPLTAPPEGVLVDQWVLPHAE